MGEIRRVELPSGGWWDLETEPTWGEVIDYQAEALSRLSSEGDEDDPAVLVGLSNLPLLRFTRAWSFPEQINEDTLRQRSALDLVPVLEVVNSHLRPLFDAMQSRRPTAPPQKTSSQHLAKRKSRRSSTT